MTCQVLSSSWSIAPASQLARSQQGLGSKAALVLQPLPAQVFKQLQAAPARPRGLRTSTAAQGVPMPSGWRRWKFGDMHKKKKEDRVDKTELFVMLPLDIIGVGELSEGNEVSFIQSLQHNAALLDRYLATLKKTGIDGVMLDVWWGIVERHGPQQYDFSAYMELFKKARRHGLKVQAVMSFHAGGGNVGDGATDIPLPPWVMKAGEELADEIFYTDQGGGRDHEYISLGCDHEAVLAGRTPIQCYVDYVSQFKQECKKNNLWGDVVTEICLGLGPCGELRYPAYQEAPDKWSFMGQRYGSAGFEVQTGIPGIGEFQCYDRFMLENLKEHAERNGKSEWSQPPGIGAGTYAAAPWETSFFALTDSGGWTTPYGKFFMEWYSGALVKHAEDVLDAMLPVMDIRPRNVLDVNNDGRIDHRDLIAMLSSSSMDDNSSKPEVELAIKVAGIHWWYNSPSHAAEMTAGYYNYYGHDGYRPIAECLRARNCGLSFTCIEMSDTDNPEYRQSSPEGLVRQVTQTAKELGVPLLGENALEGGLYNQAALDKMLQNIHNFERVTLLRLNPWMFVADNDAESGFQMVEPMRSFVQRVSKAEAREAAPAEANQVEALVH